MKAIVATTTTAYCELSLQQVFHRIPTTEVQIKAIVATTTALQMAEPTNESLIVAVI